MDTISFSFTEESSEKERLATLQKIQGWLSVRGAGLIKANAIDPETRRMATLVLKPEAEPAEVLEKLKKFPVVQHTSIPALRGIAES